MYVFQSADEVIEVLSRYRKIGADQVIVSEMSADPEKAMRIYSRQVIPYFSGGGDLAGSGGGSPEAMLDPLEVPQGRPAVVVETRTPPRSGLVS